MRRYLLLMRSPIFSSVIIILFLAACQGRLSKYGEEFAELMQENDGLFRGVNIGDTREQVVQAEGGEGAENTDQQLVYEGPVGEAGTYTIRYTFENDHLFEILVEASFEQTENGRKMLLGFRNYFNDQYGPYGKEAGYLVWKTPAGAVNQDVTIEMTDESEYTELKQWSLSIYHQAPSAGPVVNEPAL